MKLYMCMKKIHVNNIKQKSCYEFQDMKLC